MEELTKHAGEQGECQQAGTAEVVEHRDKSKQDRGSKNDFNDDAIESDEQVRFMVKQETMTV